MSIKTCPDEETLSQLLLGKLPELQAEKLEGHLLHCEDCASRSETIIANDELTDAIQAPEIVCEEEEILIEVIERAKQLHSQAETMQSYETVIGNNPLESEKASENNSDEDEEIGFLAPPEQSDEIGRLGGYRVLQILGVGGMGIVFRAEDPHLKREIALKAMKPAIAASKSARERFIREAQAIASIDHENIVHIYQVGEDHGVPFIAMQFLRGESLENRLKQETQLDQQEVLRIGREIATGLAEAHERNLIHRDIKPDNIWIEEKTGRVKILDFGLVRPAVAKESGLTQDGTILGTPKYMSPEQAQGEAVDERSDLFSLGGVLYYLVTGQTPFQGSSVVAVLMAVVQDDPQPIENLCPEVDPYLGQLIMQLLCKDPAQRLSTAMEVVERIAIIEQKLSDPSSSWAETNTVMMPQAATLPVPRSPRFPTKWLALGGLAAMFLLAAFLLKFKTPDGEIVLTGDPASLEGAEVFIDGEQVQLLTGIKGDQPIKISVDKRKGKLRVEKEGFVAFARGFDLSLGEDRKPISVKLEKFMPPAEIIPSRKHSPSLTEKKKTQEELNLAAAHWVLWARGKLVVVVQGQPVTLSHLGELPEEPFLIQEINFSGNQKVNDAGLRHLKGLKHLKKIDLSKTNITDAGLEHLAELNELTSLSLWGNTSITDEGMQHLARLHHLDTLNFSSTSISDAGFQQLSDLSQLSCFSAFGTVSGDKTLERLKDSTGLKRLSVGSLTTNEGLKNLSEMKDLTDLYISSSRVTDAGMAHIIHCTKLKELSLHSSDISDQALQHLYHFPDLQMLSLANTKITDSGLKYLDTLKQLQTLHLSGTQISDRGLKPLESLKQLERVDFIKTKVTFAAVASLKKALPQCKITHDTKKPPQELLASEKRNRLAAEWVLEIGGTLVATKRGRSEWLTITHPDALPTESFQIKAVFLEGNSNVTDEGLSHFNNLNGLTRLNLYETGITNAGLKYLTGLNKLSVLYLGMNPKITDKGIAILPEMKNLKELNLNFTGVTGEGIQQLSDRLQLTVLCLLGTASGDQSLKRLRGKAEYKSLMVGDLTTNEGLEVLSQMKNLKKLLLNGSKVTDSGLLHLEGLDNLKDLELQQCDISDDGLQYLRYTPNLKLLYLQKTKITDAGLAHLNRISLESLGLNKTQITDAGLKQLEAHKKLKTLLLEETQVTPAGVEALSKILPQCTITYSNQGKTMTIKPHAASDHSSSK